MSLLYNSPCRGPDGRSYKTGLGLTYQNDRLGCLCDVGSTVQHSTLQYSTIQPYRKSVWGRERLEAMLGERDLVRGLEDLMTDRTAHWPDQQIVLQSSRHGTAGPFSQFGSKGRVQKFMLGKLVDFFIKWVGGVPLVHLGK